MSRVVKDAVVIPQRATFEILAKKYVFTVEPPSASPPADHVHEVVATEAGQHHPDPHAHALEHHASGEHNESADHHDTSDHDGPKGVIRQREIVILNEMDDIFLIKSGLGANDKIVLEGVRQVKDGEEVEYEYRSPEQTLNKLKYHAE